MTGDDEIVSEDSSWMPKMKLPSEFAGQPLFIKGDDWENNAMLGWTHFPWDIYAAGYKDAADALVKVLLDRKAPLDSVVYPLVFLYRQALELELKLILPCARRLAEKEPVSNHDHRLMPLWTELRTLLDRLDPRDDDPEIPAIEEVIRQLDAVDSGSFSFRYPTSKKGEVALPELRHINVRHLGEVMDSVLMMLGGIYSLLGEMESNSDFY